MLEVLREGARTIDGQPIEPIITEFAKSDRRIIALLARPGVGKTTLLDPIVQTLIQEGVQVDVISIEDFMPNLTPEELITANRRQHLIDSFVPFFEAITAIDDRNQSLTETDGIKRMIVAEGAPTSLDYYTNEAYQHTFLRLAQHYSSVDPNAFFLFLAAGDHRVAAVTEETRSKAIRYNPENPDAKSLVTDLEEEPTYITVREGGYTDSRTDQIRLKERLLKMADIGLVRGVNERNRPERKAVIEAHPSAYADFRKKVVFPSEAGSELQRMDVADEIRRRTNMSPLTGTTQSYLTTPLHPSESNEPEPLSIHKEDMIEEAFYLSILGREILNMDEANFTVIFNFLMHRGPDKLLPYLTGTGNRPFEQK
jgi:hypothetical protein